MKTASPFNWLAQELSELKAKHLYRKPKVLEDCKGVSAMIDGKAISLFSGNDYLGLSQHPELIRAASEVLGAQGVGIGSARLISGTSTWHAALEDRIAQFFGKERAILFSSGYLANLGTISALAKEGDTLILDKLCHASLIDAARLSGVPFRIYPHRNLGYLEDLLKRAQTGRQWIVTDSVFSMDGDLAPLKELVELKNQYGAYLIVDEAHGTGVFGATGRGVSEHCEVLDEIDVHIGTLSKAIGVFGGFVVGGTELVDYLVNQARTFIFETALPPSLSAAAIKAFDLIDENPALRNHLWENVWRLRAGLKKIGAPLLESDSPIIPLVFGDEKRTLTAAQFLFEQGFLIPAVRYPTVPKGKARLRVTVSSLHSQAEIDRLIGAVKQSLVTADDAQER